ncbi:MAG TPA: histidine kinase dimerization/phospho-acceptor domain-containing protein [Candidatus Dormibacteraeota bacterium]|nr:histidine kinase dimerization/phospho-acceptor domain-containing protein [Candidatus Dormibacteraeota bacterium]
MSGTINRENGHAELEEEVATMGFTRLRGVAVLVGMAEGQERNELIDRLSCNRLALNSPQHQIHREIALASDWTELAARATRLNPQAIIFGDSILPADVSLEEAARRMALFAPVIVIAPTEKQSQLITLLSAGEIDFVARSGEFLSLAAAFVERRLRPPQAIKLEFRSAWTADLPSDFAEVLRHEINNPLTGILGNAELLLSQLRPNLTPVSVQRLETVVDLAVRLRETIRCLSTEWERQHSSIHPA